MVYSVLGVTLMELFPQLFVRLFTSDSALLTLGSNMLRIYIFGAFCIGANSTYQQTYNSLGEGKKSFFFAFYRKMIILIPLIFLLPHIWTSHQVLAVILAEPISDILTTLTNTIYFKRVFIRKKLPMI